MDDLSNRVIKSYELKECVGAGGFGQVYRAYQASVGREVAVKVILPQHANQPDFIRRFEVEAQLIAHLEHPHIVPMYDYWRGPEGAFLVMRWLKGSLRTAIQRGPWSVEAASRLLDEIAGALTVAHREGVIHRDIKPDNILLDEDENAYLADFGIAKDLNVGSQTEEGAIVGSLSYITPEQINGETVTPRSDIYSLGLVMYEVLVSQKPFPNATMPIEWFSAHLNTALPHLNMQRPTLPAALNEVLQTATAKNPVHRYPNVLRFAAAFRAALPVAQQRGPAQPLTEPLTERELDILKLMVEGLSNQEIAQKLFLTIGTVKWYVNQIYTKLDVHSRHQAVQRAQQLSLLAKPDEVLSATAIDLTVPPVPERPRPAIVPRTDFINPYKGLRAFQENDAHDFFGRAALTEQLLTRLSEADTAAQFLAVVGPSGSGKSSVVNAGLIPVLRRGALPNSAHWFITEMLPGTHPLEELEAALLRVAVTSLPGLLDQLAEDRRGLVRAARRVLPPDQDVELLLVIDQFEELFTLLPDEKVRTHFIDNILSAVTDPRSRVRVILTLRADFYDKPLLYPRLAELVRSNTEVVVPLTSQELERAISGPAERIGLQFEPGLVATIIHEIGEQPGTLPLLQYALTELFERREGVTLTIDAYKTSGGISGSLARRADELFEDLDTDGQAAARQLFLRLITLGEGTEDTRRRALQSELSLLGNERTIDEVINSFVQYRLLTLDHDPVTRGPTVEIAHEALIREWNRLHEWLTESREDLRVQRRLMSAAVEWEASKYERSFLASGARLAQFETLVSDSDLALNASEKAYLEASIKAREQQTAEEQKRQAREAALERRSRNFLRGLVAVLVVASLIGFGLAALAVNQSQIAQHNATVADQNAAESQNVALVAGSQAALATGNTDLAIALALNAVTLNATSAPAQVALGEAAYAPGTIRRFIGHTDTVSDVAFNLDGHTAISIANDGIMILWDVATGAIIRRFPSGHTGRYYRICFSPDGRTTLSGGTDGLVILNDPATGKIIRRFEGHTGAVNEVRFSSDGQTALSASDDKTLILWDLATGAIIRRFTGHTAAVGGVAFSADGRTALSASDDQTLILWDVATGTQLRQFTGAYPGSYVEISRDGHYAVTGSHENTIILLWDMTTGQVIRRLKEHTGPVTDVKFSPDDKYILSGSDDGSMILWDAENGDLVRRLGRHDNSVKGVAFSPDGRYALSASWDHTLRLWDLGEGYVLRRFAGHKTWANPVQISPDGRTAVTASWDGTARVWDLQTGQELHRLTVSGQQLAGASYSPDGHTALINSSDSIILWNVDSGEIVRRFAVAQMPSVSGVTLSPDGRTFLSGFWSDSSVWLWDAATGEVIRRFVGHTSNVLGLAFSPDGRTVLTGDTGGGIILWDVATGQPIRHFVGHTDLVGRVKFSKDGRTALSWGAVNGSNLWDVASGTILRHFDGGEIFSPDERTVFGPAGTALGSNAAVLVDVATGNTIRRFTGFDTLALGNSFSSDGRRVLVGFQDGKLELWRIDSPDELITWTRANRYIAELPCDQRLLYKLTATCDANAATPTATPYPTVPLTIGTDSP